MNIGPQKIKLSDIAINGSASLIAGIAGGVTILIITFLLGDLINISGNLINKTTGGPGNLLFPILLSVITLIGTSISVFLSLKMFSLTSPLRYSNNNIVYTQIGFFIIFLYILLTPIYIWTGLLDYDNTMIVFLVHVLLLKFGVSIVLETISNYKYILISLYGSFFGLIVTSIATIALFNSFDSGVAKLIALVALVPIINVSMVVTKQLFELAYYKYYLYYGIDSLGDIFERVRQEEEDMLRIEEEENLI